jgi:hypothetical protein
MGQYLGLSGERWLCWTAEERRASATRVPLNQVHRIIGAGLLRETRSGSRVIVGSGLRLVSLTAEYSHRPRDGAWSRPLSPMMLRPRLRTIRLKSI